MNVGTGTDVEAILTPELRGWLLITARSLYPANSRVAPEDLAQEGWVAMWKASKKYDPEKGTLTALVKVAARRRMVDVLREAKYYVQTGRNSINLEIPVPTQDDGDIEANAAVTVWDMLTVSDNIDKLIMAYHEGEIWEAINELPEKQRAYVLLRFYRGFTDTEAMKLVGCPNSKGMWSKTKVILKGRLEHLVSTP